MDLIMVRGMEGNEKSKEFLLLEELCEVHKKHHFSFEEFKTIWIQDREASVEARRKLGVMYEGWTLFLGFASNLTALPEIKSSLLFVQNKLIDAATAEKGIPKDFARYTTYVALFLNVLLMVAIAILILKDSPKEFRSPYGSLTNGQQQGEQKHEGSETGVSSENPNQRRGMETPTVQR